MNFLIRNLFLLFAVLSLTALAGGCKSEDPALQVNDVVSDPGAFSGKVAVLGIVYGYGKKDRSVVGIMDKKELQCTTPNCKKVLLPVKVKGPVPAIGEEVKVSGSFTKAPWGYTLNAEKVEVLARHNLGGQG